jgi:PBP superfamily domain
MIEKSSITSFSLISFWISIEKTKTQRMKFVASTLVLLGAAATVSGANPAWCGPEGGNISIAGSSTVFPIAEKWAASYMANCSGINVTVAGGGSSAGAGQVCNDPDKGSPVDIGTMSRDWKDTEGNATDGYTYACLVGDTTRSAIQLDVSSARGAKYIKVSSHLTQLSHTFFLVTTGCH